MKTEIIGNHTYQIYPLPALKSIKVATRLIQILGPSFGDVVAGLNIKSGKVDLGALDMNIIGKGVATLAGVLKEGDLEYLIENVLGEYVKLETDNKIIDLTKAFSDVHFAGKVGELFKVLFAALKENFGDFLGASGNTNPAAQ